MVYIVDDGVDYRFLLDQVFKRFLPKISVRFFADGDELRQHVLAQGDSPRVILLDLDMPVLNGRQTLQFLKQQSAWKHIPVIIMTNSVSGDDMTACYDLGVNSFLMKPAGLEQMQQDMQLICQYWLATNQLPGLKPVLTT